MRKSPGQQGQLRLLQHFCPSPIPVLGFAELLDGRRASGRAGEGRAQRSREPARRAGQAGARGPRAVTAVGSRLGASARTRPFPCSRVASQSRLPHPHPAAAAAHFQETREPPATRREPRRPELGRGGRRRSVSPSGKRGRRQKGQREARAGGGGDLETTPPGSGAAAPIPG